MSEDLLNQSPSPPPNNLLRLMFLGDVFGEPGRKAVSECLPGLKERLAVDFVVINGENSANGRGITPKICIGLMRSGAAVVTLGDHAWDQAEIIPYMDTEPRLLRPVNYPPGTPGQGTVILETPKGKVAVMNAQARTFMGQPLDNPFNVVPPVVEKLREETPIIFCDFHGEATSEKIAFGRMLDGLVSGVIGTHTHVQTADETILPKGTAYLTDAGMCGPEHSVIGSEPEGIVRRFQTQIPSRNVVAKGDVLICGAWIDIDTTTGLAVQIQRIRERVRIPS